MHTFQTSITGTCIRIDGGSSLNAKAYELPRHRNSAPYQGFHRAVPPQVLARQAGDEDPA